MLRLDYRILSAVNFVAGGLAVVITHQRRHVGLNVAGFVIRLAVALPALWLKLTDQRLVLLIANEYRHNVLVRLIMLQFVKVLLKM